MPHTARHLSLVAADSAAAAPAPRVLRYPDGVEVPLLERGLYRCRCLWGDGFVVYAVDSAGDSRGIMEVVPMTATPAEVRAVERRLWTRLDACDPVAGPSRLAGSGV